MSCEFVADEASGWMAGAYTSADIDAFKKTIKAAKQSKQRAAGGAAGAGGAGAGAAAVAAVARDLVPPQHPAAPCTGKYYVTTAINYTNGAPHMGHAYEAVTSDVIARFQRVAGKRTFFLTGSDEHGQKVAQTAEEKGKTPQAMCDQFSEGFQALNRRLKISNDGYIRTTQDRHKALAQKLWRKVNDNGDIYLDKYEGWYDVGEERYVTETEAEAQEYKDERGRPLEKKNEESFFFRMSKYKERLLEHIRGLRFCRAAHFCECVAILSSEGRRVGAKLGAGASGAFN